MPWHVNLPPPAGTAYWRLRRAEETCCFCEDELGMPQAPPDELTIQGMGGECMSEAFKTARAKCDAWIQEKQVCRACT